MAKLLLTNDSVLVVITSQSKFIRGDDDLGLIHFNEATLLLSREEDARLLVLAADSGKKKQSFSSSFQAQFLYHFGKKVQPPYNHLYDGVDR